MRLGTWPLTTVNHRLLGGALLVLAGAALALLPLQAAAATVLAGVAALAVFLRAEYGLYLLAFTIPFGSLAEVQVGAFTATPTEAVIALTLASALTQAAAKGEGRLRLTLLSIPLAAFLGLMVLSAAMAPSLAAGLKEVFKWTELFIVFLIVANILRQRRQIYILAGCIAAAALLEALLGWFQFFTRYGPPSFLIGGFLRPYGTFEQPNPYAGYLTLSLALLGGLVLGHLRGGGWRRHIPALTIFGGAAAIIGIALMMTFSRGAWLALAVAVGVMAALWNRRILWLISLFLMVGVLVGLAGAFGALPAAITSRLAFLGDYLAVLQGTPPPISPENWAVMERLAIWQSSWNMFLNNPVLGVGVGNFDLAYPSYALPDWPSLPGHAHNYYLNLLAETGLLGLTAYLGLLASAFAYGGRVLWAYGKGQGHGVLRYSVALGVLGTLTALSVHSLFDNLYVHSMAAQVGLSLGLLRVVHHE